MIIDMSEGKPLSVLLKFSLPMMVSVMFQQMYNIVDSVVAGQYGGADGLAAVGASYPITTLFLAVASGLNIGASVVISQLFGKKRFEDMKTAVSTSLIICVVYSLFVTAAGYAGRHGIMRLLGTPDNIYGQADVYLRIYIYGLFFLFLYNICNGVFTALGDSRTPLYFLMFSSVLNIILDLVFTASLGMGVAGVAWATFIAQGLASVMAFGTLLFRMKKIESGPWARYSMKAAFQINRIALPSMLQQASISIGNMVIQSIVNGYGSAVIAGYAAGTKVNTFASITLTTLGSAYSNYVAQNIGAQKWERVKEGFRACLKILYAAGIFAVVLYILLAKPLILMFLKADQQQAIWAGMEFLYFVAPGYLLLNIKLACDGVLRGSGAMGEFMVDTFSDLILRCLFAWLLSSLFQSPAGIWFSWNIGWGGGAAFAWYFYKKGKWKEQRI